MVRVFLGSFDESAGLEHRAGADEGHEMGCVHRAPAHLGGLDELEGHGEPSVERHSQRRRPRRSR